MPLSVGADAGAGNIGESAAGEGAAAAGVEEASCTSSSAVPSIVSCAPSMAFAAEPSFRRKADVSAGEGCSDESSAAAAMALLGLAATKAKILVRGERCAYALPFFGMREASTSSCDPRRVGHAWRERGGVASNFLLCWLRASDLSLLCTVDAHGANPAAL